MIPAVLLIIISFCTYFFYSHCQRLFKRLITEDIGADLNQGFDTFIDKKGMLCLWKIGYQSC